MPTLAGKVTPHFSWHECECHSDPPTPVPAEYHDNARAVCRELERIRRVLGNVPLAVSRIYSTPIHNALVGGAVGSQHLAANAADVLPPGHVSTTDLARLIQMLANEPESRIRFIKHYPDHHVHFDLRKRQTLLVEGL
jgi:hypothetical protein